MLQSTKLVFHTENVNTYINPKALKVILSIVFFFQIFISFNRENTTMHVTTVAEVNKNVTETLRVQGASEKKKRVLFLSLKHENEKTVTLVLLNQIYSTTLIVHILLSLCYPIQILLVQMSTSNQI